MDYFPTPPQNTRIGFHYYPDTLHYRESDLHTWLPELRLLGASWLVIEAPLERAIPEYFLRGLIGAHIEPILHFKLPLQSSFPVDSCQLLFEQYAEWGVHYAALFDRPNLRSSWPTSSWAQSDLVERFLDLYLPIAEYADRSGLIPVYPPLEPGGDYWDTAFLRASLRSMVRRNQASLLEHTAFGAYAWAGNRPIAWGAGGPERWPAARPYILPSGVQDQRGFRIFDWYRTLIQAELGELRPILLIGAGSRPGDDQDTQSPAVDLETHTRQNLEILRLMRGDTTPAEGALHPGKESLPGNEKSGEPADCQLEEVSPDILGCNYWLLAAGPESDYLAHAWFQPDGSTLPIVGVFRQWNHTVISPAVQGGGSPQTRQAGRNTVEQNRTAQPALIHPIEHYLLLPLYEWGVAEWHLDVIRSFVKKYHPTVGFSIDEACLARQVTILGGSQSIPDGDEERLRTNGCAVTRISGNGTTIATRLNSL